MKQTIKTNDQRLPIRLWSEDIDGAVLEQVKNLANLPFAYKHISVMADGHLGYGMPIGGVLAAVGVIIPNAVGYDIGCGVCAVKTNVIGICKEQLKNILGNIRKVIPVGFKWRQEKIADVLMPYDNLGVLDFGSICMQEYQNARSQLGTLGGGNHFIEIQEDTEGYIWIMIHSGSRNIGKKVAEHYNKVAVDINSLYHSSVPKEWELAFLPLDTREARGYIQEMEYCIRFALENRKLMMDKVKRVISEEVSGVEYDVAINIAHNYARMENHFKKNVMVHRKGATSAKEGQMGIIPGSQGSKSYIVRGLGNPDSFESCSHGAGRKMGRKAAQRNLNLEEEQKRLNDLGVLHSIRGKKDLDEATGAYKDIDLVMENQADLVEVVTELKPLAVIKG